MLSVEYHLSLEKISSILSDLFAAPVNESTIVSWLERGYQSLEPSIRAIAAAVMASSVIHSDETGIYYEARRNWLHTASTALYTYQFVHDKRGRQALESQESILPEYRGTVIHDCWQTYFSFTLCEHGLCGSHLLRELQAISEQGRHWAWLMKRLLMAIYHSSDNGRGALSQQDYQRAVGLYHRILCQADQEEPPPERRGNRGRLHSTKGRNMLERLRKYEGFVLAFARRPEVPFTNNQAERDIRPTKVKQKVSGSFRTVQGARQYVRIHSFLSTARKHGRNAWHALKDAFQGRSFLTAPDAPA